MVELLRWIGTWNAVQFLKMSEDQRQLISTVFQGRLRETLARLLCQGPNSLLMCFSRMQGQHCGRGEGCHLSG